MFIETQGQGRKAGGDYSRTFGHHLMSALAKADITPRQFADKVNALAPSSIPVTPDDVMAMLANEKIPDGPLFNRMAEVVEIGDRQYNELLRRFGPRTQTDLIETCKQEVFEPMGAFLNIPPPKIPLEVSHFIHPDIVGLIEGFQKEPFPDSGHHTVISSVNTPIHALREKLSGACSQTEMAEHIEPLLARYRELAE